MIAPLRAAVLLGLLALLSAAGCAARGPRPYTPQAANALPVADPTTRGTALGQAFPLAEAEQLVVKMGQDIEGRVVVLQVLSPVLTPEQQEEVRRAFSLGGYKRQAPLQPQPESWIETIVRNKP